MSARTHQAILFKPALEAAIATAGQVGAVGLNVARNGTIMGILLDPRHSDTAAVTAYLRPWLPELARLYCARLVGGGARVSAG